MDQRMTLYLNVKLECNVIRSISTNITFETIINILCMSKTPYTLIYDTIFSFCLVFLPSMLIKETIFRYEYKKNLIATFYFVLCRSIDH